MRASTPASASILLRGAAFAMGHPEGENQPRSKPFMFNYP